MITTVACLQGSRPRRCDALPLSYVMSCQGQGPAAEGMPDGMHISCMSSYVLRVYSGLLWCFPPSMVGSLDSLASSVDGGRYRLA